MLNLNKRAKTKPKPTLIFKNCSYVCISLCTTVVHNTAQNSSDNFPLILQTITIAQITSTGDDRAKRFIKLRFYVPLDTKYVMSETFFLANLLA